MFFQASLQLLLSIAVASGAILAQNSSTGVQEETCVRGRCLAEILDSLRGSYQILPGVNISSTSSVAVRSTSASDAVASYLKSLTLHVALYNEPIASFFGAVQKGRSKRPSSSSKFKFLSVYTVFAVAFALLSALVGKAVTLSIIALVITIVAATRGIGFGANNPANSPPVFDIVRRPHIQVQHTQSAEEVYEAPGTAGGAVSYVYPIRGRAVPVEETYHTQSVHVAGQTEGHQAERHIHIS